MTTRLYYEDAYLSQFEARVVDRTEIDGRCALALDQTAFYPTGGGQPCDNGTLNGVAVLDVRAGSEVVWHLLESSLDSTTVAGRIDWRRRRDHMQNHSGQHILSQAFVVMAGASTVAWRLSDHTVTIDLDRASLPEEALVQAEQLTNEVVQQNRPISARIVDEAELPALALRKQPDVDGPLRIVTIADFDQVACSGTHVRGTAQVGLVKVLRAERRGPETRIHFVCGQRAMDDYDRKHQIVRDLATRFTCGEDEIPLAVQRLQEDAQSKHKALKAAQQGLVDAEAARFWAQVQLQPVPRLIRGLYPAWDDEQVKALALALKRLPGSISAVAGGHSALVFIARADDVPLDAGQLLRAALAQVGGRGGGRPEYAQGSAPNWAAAERAIELVSLPAHLQET
jgi:alanyl-tRNA synthetase